jgi:hypothetical protein
LRDFEDCEVSEYYAPVLIFRNSAGNEILVNFAVCWVDKPWGLDSEYVFECSNILNVQAFYTFDEYKLSQLQKQEQEKMNYQKKAIEEEKKHAILKNYGDYYGKLINNQKVVIGMTMDMCKLAWGEPILKNEMESENGKLVIWQYNYKTFLYFKNNQLSVIQQ